MNNTELIKEKEEKRRKSIEHIVEKLRNGKVSSDGLTLKMVEDFKNNADSKRKEQARRNHLKKELEDQIKEKEKN